MSKPRQETNSRRLALRFFAGLCAAVALPLLLVGQMPLAPDAGLVWDWANALGYLGLALCLLLFVYAGRPRDFPPFSGRFFANLHRDLGYLALLLVLAHVGLLLVVEPLLLEHLKPTAPLYMLAGLVALLLLLLLVVTSITDVRKRIWSDYHRFKWLHACFAVACVPLLGWHVLGSGFYLNTRVKLVAGVLAACALVAYYLRGRLLARGRTRRGPRLRDTAVYSHLVSYGSVALLALLSLLLLLLRLPQ